MYPETVSIRVTREHLGLNRAAEVAAEDGFFER